MGIPFFERIRRPALGKASFTSYPTVRLAIGIEGMAALETVRTFSAPDS